MTQARIFAMKWPEIFHHSHAIYIYIYILDLNIQQHVARIWQLHATQVRAIIKTVRCSVVTSCDAFREGRDKCSQVAGYVLKTCLTKQ